jgi:hypothetical protein
MFRLIAHPPSRYDQDAVQSSVGAGLQLFEEALYIRFSLKLKSVQRGLARSWQRANMDTYRTNEALQSGPPEMDPGVNLNIHGAVFVDTVKARLLP